MKAFDLDSVYVQHCSISEVWKCAFLCVMGFVCPHPRCLLPKLERLTATFQDGWCSGGSAETAIKRSSPAFLCLETCSLSSAHLFSLSGSCSLSSAQLFSLSESCSAIFFEWKPAQLFHQDSGLMQSHTHRWPPAIRCISLTYFDRV